jgi:hypothetical protein
VTNGFAIPFIEYANPIYQFPYTFDVTLTAFFCMTIYISICLLFQFAVHLDLFKKILEGHKINKRYKQKIKNFITYDKPSLWFWIFIVVSILGFIRFMIFSNGILYLGAALSHVGNTYDYYTERAFVNAILLASGNGAGLAIIVMSYLGPTLIGMAFYFYGKMANHNFFRRIAFWLLVSLLNIMIILIAFTLSKKVMILYSILFPIVILLGNRANEMQLNKLFSFKLIVRILVMLILFIGIGSIISSTVSGQSLVLGVEAFLERIFVVPAGTNNFYYALFPDRLPYRGMSQMFDMAAQSNTPNDISYLDIAVLSTGYSFGANAFFLAIAYSGASFIGVSIVSFLFCVLAVCNDYWLDRVDPKLNLILIFASSYAIFGLCNTPIFTSIINYGFVLSSLIARITARRSQLTIRIP